MSDHFDRLKSLVLEARALDGAARAAFLAEACGADEGLRRDAESLLAHAEDAVPVLSAAAAVRFVGLDALAALEREADEGAQPATVGPYQIRGVLGQGGMGTVYEAEQVKPIRRLVALKLIRRGLDTDAVIARFKTERQALALMDHPAIARVLDAGASDDGRPYFVMELVAGVPITQYCRDRQLGVRQTLQLFLAVCQGVRHAHQKGIVHRDLKPSNVLVRETDGVAAPKIIDFGIAKAIDATGGDTGLEPATRIGGTAGTPDYMSPEQAGVIPGGVDTRTDVYSLGVLLFEILTARRPYTFSMYTPGEIARVLRGPEPRAPSAAAPDRRRQLSGDLDNIVARALARQPADRYASVEQFADDIRRHLEGEPVLAREATWPYRTAKFVGRHTAAVAVAATLAVLIVGAGVTFAVQAARLAAERDRARSAEQLAREQVATAESVVGFLVDLFQTSDPSEARGNTITAREILDRGAQRIESDLRETPQVQATLLGTMGRVYQSLGLYTVAQPLLQRALERRREVFGMEHAAVGESLDQLALLLRKRGDYAGAEPLFREALAIKRRTQGPDHRSIAETMTNLGFVLRNTDRGAEAEPFIRENLAMRLRLFGPEHHEVAEGMHELGATLWRNGDLAGAQELLRRALDLDRRLLGEIHPVVSVRWHTLGQILRDSGQFATAEEALRKALDINKTLNGPEHPDVAHASTGLAWLLIKQGKVQEAEPLLETALDLHRRLVGEESPWVSSDLQGLGLLKLRAREYAEAEQVFRRGLALATKIYGPESSWAAEATMNLGSAIQRQGRIAEAEPMLRRAEALWAKTRGVRHPDYARYVWELASAVAARGGLEEGEKLHRQALEIRRTHLSARDADVAASLASLGMLLIDRGDPRLAEPLLREAVDIYREALPPGDHTRTEAERALARCETALR
ncbi:MAG TPA: serine/threonine-protein kinase [Vicinamibacterales bacterium]|nr:serine/threonine-protein kinase [Vicinamibacterales bacterium]